MISESQLKTITALIAILGLIFSVYQFIQIQKIEAAKPYLVKKLAWCEEIVEITAFIATAETNPKAELLRFKQMYWGVLGLVEKNELSKAMVSFDNALEARDSLGIKSLTIAHACRKELTTEWSEKWAK
ncbi:MAG: hypothetical protein COB77_07630 [Gammaproteobacteria bacterium]|nr:MAG: hypothetical protein COB77_07630 [Gammaproteobacteria bacterium]